MCTIPVLHTTASDPFVCSLDTQYKDPIFCSFEAVDTCIDTVGRYLINKRLQLFTLSLIVPL